MSSVLLLSLIAHKILAMVIDDSVSTRTLEKKFCRTSTDEDVVELLQTHMDVHSLASHDEQISPVLFLKTHKTGGSTIASILNRLGDAWNKEFLLPCDPESPSHLGWPGRFPGEGCVKPSKQFDIICNHAVYNRTAMLAYLKKSKSPFIFTILRDPLSQIQSAFNYFNSSDSRESLTASLLSKEPTAAGNMLLKQLVDLELAGHEDVWDKRIHILKEMKNNPAKFRKVDRARFLNSQSYDLGWYEAHDGSSLPSDEDIQKWFEGLDFSYVMLTDMYDEGLVLLSQKLHLTLEDVSNVHLKQESYPQPKPSAKQFLELQDLLHLDFKLFAHYKSKFMKEWERYGDSQALEKLRELNDRISSVCAQLSPRVQAQSVYSADCPWRMRADVEEFDEYLRQKQSRKL